MILIGKYKVFSDFTSKQKILKTNELNIKRTSKNTKAIEKEARKKSMNLKRKKWQTSIKLKNCFIKKVNKLHNP